MHDKDLEKKFDRERAGGRSGDVSGSRDGISSGSTGHGGANDRMRNRDDIDPAMSDEGGEDLQRKQREGNLGNERARGGSPSRDDMRGAGE